MRKKKSIYSQIQIYILHTETHTHTHVNNFLLQNSSVKTTGVFKILFTFFLKFSLWARREQLSLFSHLQLGNIPFIPSLS